MRWLRSIVNGKGTSIGFGGGDVIQVNTSLHRMRRKLERAIPRRQLLQLKSRGGEAMVINPMQVKVLQRAPSIHSKPAV